MNGLAVRVLPYALAFFSSLCIMILELVAGRLVARHVGASLTVWTSVIGIMLGGICLGNVLGGRLADRVTPRDAIGPLYALGAALTVVCLWVNSIVGYLPGLDYLPDTLRTVLVVLLVFLVPGTVLGMIGPVVAKIAVEQSRRSGSALGDVYFWGAVGSIAGTFLAGFILIYAAPTSTIVTVVAAALAFLAACLQRERTRVVLCLATSALLGIGSIGPVIRMMPWRGLPLGPIFVNPVALIGHFLAFVAGAAGVLSLRRARLSDEIVPELGEPSQDEPGRKVKLGDLAVLAFVSSLAFMSLEMVAGRLVSEHLGSSVYGWTSVIGVLLGGLSLGNLIGGKLADIMKHEKHLSWLFLIASVLTLTILLAESPPGWLVRNPYEVWALKKPPIPLAGESGPVLSQAISLVGYDWWARVLLVVGAVFFLPAVSMGTVGPVVAKLAVDRLKRAKRTGTAIGQVYAWGMVGSILGTFLAGFVLIDLLGAKGLLLVLGASLALAATMLGSVWHAAWAGIPLGLCIFAFAPFNYTRSLALNWGISEPAGDPNITKDGIAYIDESDYYYIKISNSSYASSDGPDAPALNKRTLVLDNLIHGYFLLGHPEHIEYDYEYIYAQVTHRIAAAKAKAKGSADPYRTPLRTMFIGGGSYTFPRYLQHLYPGTSADVAEIDPAVTEANHIALGLPRNTTIKTTWGDARRFVEKWRGAEPYDIVFGDAFNDFSVPWHLTTREFNDKVYRMLGPEGVYMINIIDVYESDEQAESNAEAEKLAYDQARKDAEAERDAKEASTEARSKFRKMKPPRSKKQALADAHNLCGFLGAWVNTARLTFPYIYVFGTHSTPGSGQRETFVVVAAKTKLELSRLGLVEGEPMFDQDSGGPFLPKAYGKDDMEAIDLRSHGLILTDDYAPVEDLLAPVARTRGDSE